MAKFMQILVVLIVGVTISACDTIGGTKPDGATVDEKSTTRDGSTGAAGDSASSTALPGAGEFKGHPLDNPDSPLASRIIYFDFDKSDVRPESQAILSAHGAYLAANPGSSVTLEGHADERGSREYNIGLGERRAQSVRRLLLFQGASDNQIQTVSYGEERPVALGHDDESWSKNRRVELVYKR
jgi:peptidoglycan-associated lipoprotein